MNVVFVTEARFIKDDVGNIFCDASFDRELWDRYLRVFGHVFVFARVKFDPSFKGSESFLSSACNVTFIELPYYIGPVGFLFRYFQLRRVVKSHVRRLEDSAFILRVPGLLGAMVADCLIGIRKKYALEVVGDPSEVFSAGSFSSPFNFFYRLLATSELKRCIRHASAISYVTRHTLQEKYPAPLGAFVVGVSDVKISDEVVSSHPKKWRGDNEINIISIGSLAQMYKSPDIVLKAVAELVSQYPEKKFKLVWLGDGFFRASMESLAKELGISDNVKFLGNVSSEDVFAWLAASDIFVLASRTEGLPRVVVEAMSQGIPVVGTRVGGVPELLDSDVLIQKDDYFQLANMLAALVNNESLYNSQAARNLSFANQFMDSNLAALRSRFYSFIANGFQ